MGEFRQVQEVVEQCDPKMPQFTGGLAKLSPSVIPSAV
jgi:hypothetical protein